jgi:hypothetical protein
LTLKTKTQNPYISMTIIMVLLEAAPLMHAARFWSMRDREVTEHRQGSR